MCIIRFLKHLHNNLCFSTDAPPQSTRERPPGCRTVFIGGLPGNMTEELVREIFEHCAGPRGIVSLRMSNKNFCHIRFESEECVDKALFYSGGCDLYIHLFCITQTTRWCLHLLLKMVNTGGAQTCLLVARCTTVPWTMCVLYQSFITVIT